MTWDPHNTGTPPAPPHFGHASYAPNPQQAAPPPVETAPDLTEDVVLNDDVEFEVLSSLPDQALSESIRFAFLLFDDAGDLRMRAGKMFYGRLGEKRFPFLAPPDTHPLFARCVEKWNMPKLRLGAIVLAYNTDKEGNFIQGDTFKYRLHALHVNDITAKWLRAQNKRRSFRTHDLMRTGAKATQFGVEYSYSVEDECVFATLPADKQAEILDKALALHAKYLGPSIGRPRPDVEIDDLLRDIDPTLRRQGGGQPQQVNPWAGAPGYGQPQLPGYGQPQPQLGYQPQMPQYHQSAPTGAVPNFGQQLAAASQSIPVPDRAG